MEFLKDFDVLKAVLWIVPGAFFALARSFAIRGSFPGITKDDLAAFSLGSVIYFFAMLLPYSGKTPSSLPGVADFSSGERFWLLFFLPTALGVAVGFVEAADAVGRTLRKLGVQLPSPDATAWETIFREMQTGTVLSITLKDGSQVYGRWIAGRGGSASSTDPKTMDLFLGEAGEISARGEYKPRERHGIYIAPGEIRTIEIVPPKRDRRGKP